MKQHIPLDAWDWNVLQICWWEWYEHSGSVRNIFSIFFANVWKVTDPVERSSWTFGHSLNVGDKESYKWWVRKASIVAWQWNDNYNLVNKPPQILNPIKITTAFKTRSFKKEESCWTLNNFYWKLRICGSHTMRDLHVQYQAMPYSNRLKVEWIT